MTNNEKLALKLKSAAEKAGAEEWQVKRNGPGEYEVMVKGSLVKHSGWSTHRPVTDEVVDKKTADFIASASPANILSLLAERDADKKLIAELNDTLERECEKSRRMASRIAELEARAVSVKLPKNTPLVDAPEHIWLQTAGEWPANAEFSELTWCSDRQHDDDTLYVRADLAAGIKLEVGE